MRNSEAIPAARGFRRGLVTLSRTYRADLRAFRTYRNDVVGLKFVISKAL